MSSPPSSRERILSAAMDAFMENGFAATTTLEIATRAKVSKRELYALFGSKEQMLAICVAERGKRMRLPEDFPSPTDRASLHAALRQFGLAMITQLFASPVVEVFRLGITEAKRSGAVAKSIVENGRKPSLAGLLSLLQPARAAGLLVDGDIEHMASHFGALLWGDVMVWLLLGTIKAPTTKEMGRRAEETAALFLKLYGR